jgi:Insertion element 4 transposase N-terminal
VSQCVTSGAGSAMPDVGADAGRLREAVLAGPGAAMSVNEGWREGAVGLLADGEVIAAALAREGHVDVRSRVLTGAVTVAVVLGLCLFRRDNYDVVLARMLAAMPGVLAPGERPPKGQALSGARARLEGAGAGDVRADRRARRAADPRLVPVRAADHRLRWHGDRSGRPRASLVQPRLRRLSSASVVPAN